MSRRSASWFAGSRFTPNQIHTWKRALIEQASSIFDRGENSKASKSDDAKVSQLYEQIGRLTVERDFLEAGLGR